MYTSNNHMYENPEQYITRWGRFMQKMTIDELPPILNPVKDDMLIVGSKLLF